MNNDNKYEESKNNIDTNSATEKKRLVDIVGILSHSISEQTHAQIKGKLFDQIREEAITKYLPKKIPRAKTCHKETNS
ncbi:hypothetical protein [Paenibacillus sp. FSL K6-1558]|uniref:hypothetical protein n=1 Tax=Paenibacillus sp. FSL K6-1558 TaxID=2921473 RepID=UPI0030F60A71